MIVLTKIFNNTSSLNIYGMYRTIFFNNTTIIFIHCKKQNKYT
ncbi:hypothetical protein CLOLEP_01292 [[Clostridium] leptum DSM 753]|uniref:Uncharacterized protein n=1 Tax=[Clostridium] leptum DSM 753 TaxID=428125 RepID=A7VRV5_9FIRM|nr:hypothetical protein CLOLEP_01292 [[Clostridium] leptum DSM 753]